MIIAGFFPVFFITFLPVFMCHSGEVIENGSRNLDFNSYSNAPLTSPNPWNWADAQTMRRIRRHSVSPLPGTFDGVGGLKHPIVKKDPNIESPNKFLGLKPKIEPDLPQDELIAALANVYNKNAISKDPNGVKFFLYSKPSIENYTEELQYLDVNNLKQSNFRRGRPLKILIHGYTSTHLHKSVQKMKNAYLERMRQRFVRGSKVNVVIVDYGPLGNPGVEGLEEALYYIEVLENVPVVGRRIAEFVNFLMENQVVSNLKDVHIIGFSLGAHVAGSAGHEIKQLNGGRMVGRVTGLDPAAPPYGKHSNFLQNTDDAPLRLLNKNDASFVDVIHTNIGIMGIELPLGHADFYVNGGGPNQKSCEVEYEQRKLQGSLSNRTWDVEFLYIASCSHNKAPVLYAKSILNRNMIAVHCKNSDLFNLGRCNRHKTAVFGEYCNPNANGNFYINVE